MKIFIISIFLVLFFLIKSYATENATALNKYAIYSNIAWENAINCTRQVKRSGKKNFSKTESCIASHNYINLMKQELKKVEIDEYSPLTSDEKKMLEKGNKNMELIIRLLKSIDAM